MILITGCAGFIGFHLAKELSKKTRVIGVDSLNNYYSVKLKKQRLGLLRKNKNFKFFKIDLNNFNKLKNKLKNQKLNCIVHLAAQPGVRISIKDPHNTLTQNLLAFSNTIELGRLKKLKNLFMPHQVLFTVIQKYIHLLKMISKIYPNQFMEQLNYQMRS